MDVGGHVAQSGENGLARFDGPLVEPVRRAAVDERREHAAAHAEGIADWRHGEDDVEVLPNTVDKVCLDVILCLNDPRVLRVGPHLAQNLFPLVVRKEDVIDVLNERLDNDLRVGKEEHHRGAVAAGHKEELLQVLAELVQAVTLGELNLETLHFGHVRGEARERLLARAADAH
eukprot:scaffold295678_cov28-Tisochrysis_lutea.AAC.2